MHKIRYWVVFFCIATVSIEMISFSKQEAELTVVGGSQQKSPLLLCFLTDESLDFQEFTAALIKDLEFTQQFCVSPKQLHSESEKKGVIADAAKNGYWFVLSIEPSKEQCIDWRLYDALDGHHMLGKRYTKRGKVPRGWAHNIADQVWKEITGQEGWFTSKLAYCKAKKNKRGYRIQHICMADYDGSHEEEIVSLPTICVAPSWHQDMHKPKILYSEYTKTNVRLMSVDMEKQRSVLLDGDGITMLPAFCKDTTSFVYCASKGTGSCQLYLVSKGAITLLTHNEANNISPTFGADEHTVYFCSDMTGKPQIYRHAIRQGITTPITTGGFCTSPIYNPKQHQLAYLKMVKGVMQIYLFDEKTGKHRQLTNDPASKGSCVWSPCGNYLLFDSKKGSSSRLVLLQVATGFRRYLTPEGVSCSYPAWSGVYKMLPMLIV